MKKTLSAALAVSIAAGAIAVSAADASAAPRNWNWHRGNNAGAAAAIIGGIVGLGILSQAARPHYYGYPGYTYDYPQYSYPRYNYRYQGGGYTSAHVEWCLSRYRTYNPATNTYFRKPGIPAVCYSPYS
jgi:hypothetical protein